MPTSPCSPVGLPVLLRRWFGPGFTADEVRRLLRQPPTDARGAAVRRCVARPQDWLPPAPHFIACPLYYHAQLPRIIFWYMSGDSLAAIGRRVDGWLVAGQTPSSGLQHAFDTACGRIAARLNADPQEYGLRASRAGWGAGGSLR